jgi:hypothetical protein
VMQAAEAWERALDRAWARRARPALLVPAARPTRCPGEGARLPLTTRRRPSVKSAARTGSMSSGLVQFSGAALLLWSVLALAGAGGASAAAARRASRLTVREALTSLNGFPSLTSLNPHAH